MRQHLLGPDHHPDEQEEIVDKRSRRQRRRRGARPYLVRQELLVSAAKAVLARPLAAWQHVELEELVGLARRW